MIINGKEISEKIKSSLREEIFASKKKIRLAVIKVADDAVTEKYLEVKKKFAETVGMDVRIYEVPKDISTNKLREKIPEKDPDVLSSKSWGKFSMGKNKILPPVVGAVKIIFDENKIELKGKNAVVVCAGRLVGKPISTWLIEEGATVSVIDENTKNPEEYTKKKDILISGAGKPKLITPDLAPDGVVAIDCGTSESSGQVMGDIDPAVAEKALIFATVPGGVGPITIAVLFKNLFELSK